MRPILKINHAWAGYEHAPIIRDLSMELNSHSIYGLIGKQGAGKSTLLRLILSQQQLLRGELHWQDPISPAATVVGGLLKIPRLYKNLSVREHIRLFSGYYQISAAKAEQWISFIGLSAVAESRIKSCSNATLQRLSLALALMPQPRLMLIDNPEEGLSHAQGKRFMQLLTRLKQELGTSFLLASKEAGLLSDFADRIGLLENGQLQWEGNPDDAPFSFILTIPKKQSLLLDRLIAHDSLGHEWLDDHRLKVRLRWKRKISALVRQLVMHGIDVSAVEPQQASFSGIGIGRKHTVGL